MNPYVSANSITDEQLMEKYQKGEYMAFEALYYRHKNTVFTYLCKRLHDENSRDEVFQNIFMKFHKSKELYDSKYVFLKWLYTISRSELYDFCKKKKVQMLQFDETLYRVDDEVESQFDLDEFKNLSENEREAIKLKYYSDFDYDEISQKLSISQSNARKIISRGISKIRMKLAGDKNE